MMSLFGMECKKIAKGILYWVLVLALLAVSFFRYEPAVESELRRTNDPASVFYITSNGGYADERNSAPDEAMEHAMMIGATNRLIDNYRNNCYEYYPFGYVKVKTMSSQEQAAILQYLMLKDLLSMLPGKSLYLVKLLILSHSNSPTILPCWMICPFALFIKRPFVGRKGSSISLSRT